MHVITIMIVILQLFYLLTINFVNKISTVTFELDLVRQGDMNLSKHDLSYLLQWSWSDGFFVLPWRVGVFYRNFIKMGFVSSNFISDEIQPVVYWLTLISTEIQTHCMLCPTLPQ